MVLVNKPRQDITDSAPSSSGEVISAVILIAGTSEDMSCAGSTHSASSDNTMYCYCNGTDDGTETICCDNDNCASGQWFHYSCIHIKRAPRGKWYRIIQ